MGKEGKGRERRREGKVKVRRGRHRNILVQLSPPRQQILATPLEPVIDSVIQSLDLGVVEMS